ncbi:DNA cytosine methyltransferase [Cyanobacterium aponinum]|uniref:Cytosine-specific methyltransferase n=1 Tax=Cyanobacterium aponinum 0216 TaxID=2676140 RepID=A0A844GW27_9CHRO|nr:DNA cytosine methyltransferase [Cyanobacterium aponinum]MTF40360.1 DNA (cytosine-5-)-methyltransferase [Cyanobacterium aponinum 0216]
MSTINLSGSYQILQSKNKSKFEVIELFAGCGGMALGFENAGLNTKLLVDINKNSCETLQKNRSNWNVINQDITQLEFTEYANQIDVVAGGFPCQAFSHAGERKGFLDTRGTLFFDFARCIKQVQPKIVIAENVKGLITHKKGENLQIILNTLDELGYYSSYKLLNAQYFDVPQKRERVIIIAVRKDLDIKIVFPQEKNYIITLKEALKNCPKSKGIIYNQRKKNIMQLVPEGGNWRSLPEQIQKEYMKNSYYQGGGRTGFAKRLAYDEPCLTLTCSPSQTQTERCHPIETRPLTIREYARVQTFPDDWEFAGSLTSQYQQIGNAVPVNLAYHLGCSLIAMLEGKTGLCSEKVTQLSLF